MNKRNILLLEDDPNLGFILQEQLEMNNYSVKLCRNGEEGTDEYKHHKYDLCLVDIMMPKKDGFTFVKELRNADKQTPVIFLTAKSLKEDKIEGFKAGCDDYITKPFSMEELLLRINAVIRRTGDNTDTLQTVFSIGRYSFDSEKQTLTLGKKKIQLTSKEAELLRLLCINKNSVLERDTALNQIWGNNSYFNARSMDVFITKLRGYLKEDPSISIQNIRGKGYKLIL